MRLILLYVSCAVLVLVLGCAGGSTTRDTLEHDSGGMTRMTRARTSSSETNTQGKTCPRCGQQNNTGKRCSFCDKSL